jgi:hypothetical protein
MYDIQHCFIGLPSDSTVSEDARIEPRTVATTALAVRRSNHSARSHGWDFMNLYVLYLLCRAGAQTPLLYRKFGTNVPRYETARPRSQFLHLCISERFIYIPTIGPTILLYCVCVRSWEYINRSQMHECTVEIKNGAAQLHFWEFFGEFSVQCPFAVLSSWAGAHRLVTGPGE